MVTRLLSIVLRVALLVALLASVALFVDYQSGSAGGSFCGATGGCAEVRASAYSQVLGVPLPTLGLGVFLGLFVTAVWASERRHLRVLAIECGVVALGALGLIGLQLFVLKAICPWCMAVDVGALVAAVCALLLHRREPEQERTLLRYLWAGAGVVVLALPLLWPVREANVPGLLRTLQTPDRVDIITFTDFECPYCRRMHEPLDAIAHELGDKVQVVRLMRPLDQHPGAGPAARAYLCMAQDKQSAFAAQMYGMEPPEMTRENITKLAHEAGAEPEAFKACFDAESTSKQIDEVRDAFRAAGLLGLPSTFVEDHYIKGANGPALRAAVERSLAGDSGGGGDPKWMLLATVSLLLAVSMVSWLLRPVSESPNGG